MLISFRTHTIWKIPGPQNEVAELIRDTPNHVKWWKTVQRASTTDVLQRRGTFKLDVGFTTVQDTDSVIAYRVTGDMSGWATWRLSTEGDLTIVEYRQHLHFGSKIRRILGVVLHPFMSIQSYGILRSGEVGMTEYFEQRRAAGELV